MRFRPSPLRADQISFLGTYDIRGLFPQDIGPLQIDHLAAAFARVGSGPLLIGRDVRQESAKLEMLLVRALRNRGRPVISLGVQPTPAIGFAAAHFRRTALALTPSHNAIGYVGIKGFGPAGKLFAKEWKKIGALYRQSWRERGKARPASKRGRVLRHRPFTTSGWTESYLAHLTLGFRSTHLIVIDSRGGATAHLAPRALQRMGAEVKSLHPRFSPRFYGLSPEPTPADVVELGASVRRRKADFGVTFDGDGDRVAFVDRRGRWVEPEVVAIFLHRNLASEGQPLVASVDASFRCEGVLPTVRSRVGSRFVLSMIRRSRAVVGLEGSGHYYLPRLDPNSDGILVACVLAGLLERSGQRLDRLADQFGPIFRENRIVPFSSRPEAVLAYNAIRRELPKRSTEVGLDGITLRSSSGRLLFRLSNTQPVIRATLEASERPGLKRLRAVFGGVFKLQGK
jgi:phosphomannomutase / phosphoglucomutase